MRVERFFLFFPPKLWSITRGETEYGIGAIPLGGFVKITGMNPEEELEPEVAPRAYYHQPVWKRIVVIARRAGRQPRDRVRDPVRPRVHARGADRARGRRRSSSGSPAQGTSRPATSWSRSTASARRRRTADEQSDRLVDALGGLHCAGEPTDGCRATTAVPVVVERDGETETILMRPFYDADGGSVPVRLQLRRRRLRPRRPLDRRARPSFAVDRMWDGDLADGRRSSRGSSTPSSASRSPASSAATRSPGSRSSSTPARRCSCSP